MSAGLPVALQDAIAHLACDVAPRDVAARAAALTENYRSGAASELAVAGERDVAAYLTTRLPATYAAITAALDAVKERAPHFAPQRLLDAGSGPGTASWAAVEVWPHVRSVTMLDRNPHLLSAARTLADASPHPSLSSAHIIPADLLSLPSPLVGEGVGALRSNAKPTEGGSALTSSEKSKEIAHYDLIIAGYTFAEIPDHLRERVLTRLWTTCRGILVIVEPGTPKGFATILACRTALIAAGARMVAPCPAAYRCPIVSPDWCHFAERLPRSRAHMRAKAANVPFEDEKFSYVAVAREGIDLRPTEARIIAAPHASKPGLRLKLCTDAQIADRVVLKRDKPAYKAISRKTWGDAL